MAWKGKLIGGLFGVALGNPIFMLMGVIVGHLFDKGMLSNGGDEPHDWPWQQNQIQTAFFTATFSVMGYLAKSDGRVSEHEIEYARQIMHRFGLNEKMRLMAMELFTAGKQKDFDINTVLANFRKSCGRRRALLQMFVEIQMETAYVDGPLSSDERNALIKICTGLGFSPAEYARFEQVFQARQRFYSQREQQRTSSGRSSNANSTKTTLADAYAILEVPNTVGDTELKRAYRKLMSKNHPDKLVSKGLPEAMIKIATRKTQEIKEAYDRVREARGIK